MPCGSKVRLISRNASYSTGPNICSHERTAHQAIAMLAGERAAEFEHQVRDLLRDRLELAHALLGLHD